jgi:hypothetical protein
MLDLEMTTFPHVTQAQPRGSPFTHVRAPVRGAAPAASPKFYTVWVPLEQPHVFHILPPKHSPTPSPHPPLASTRPGARENAVAVRVRCGEVLVMASSVRYMHSASSRAHDSRSEAVASTQTPSARGDNAALKNKAGTGSSNKALLWNCQYSCTPLVTPCGGAARAVRGGSGVRAGHPGVCVCE